MGSHASRRAGPRGRRQASGGARCHSWRHTGVCRTHCFAAGGREGHGRPAHRQARGPSAGPCLPAPK
eukprot:2240569-Alexandrium_andersonii.AAC.1